MKKFMIIVNFVALIFFFTILAEINIPSQSGITGFVTAVSAGRIDIQPHLILAFLILFVAFALNTYFFTKGNNSLLKIRNKK